MRVLLLMAVLSPLASARAQIVHVQSRFAEEPDPGVQATVDGAIDWRSGSTDYLFMRAGLTGHGRFDPSLVLVFLNAEYAIAKELVTLNKTLEHLRYRHRLNEVLSAEAFLQHEHDEFRRIELRGLAGAGLRARLLGDAVVGAAAGLAVMAELEHLRADGQPDAGVRTLRPRLSSYLLGRLKAAEGVTLVETLYWQPRLDLPSDYRLLTDTAAVVAANAWLAVSIGFLLAYDHAPPAGVPGLDRQVKTSVTVTF